MDLQANPRPAFEDVLDGPDEDENFICKYTWKSVANLNEERVFHSIIEPASELFTLFMR